jgi:tripartite-type tricarboxylate transporter receptor subunit TctC
MKLPRRRFLHLAASAAALPIVPRSAWTQTYPTRPVRWINPAAPGGSYDIISRLCCQWLSDRLGQQFIIENRTGGGGNVGTEAVVHAPPDGYTLLLVSVTNAVNASLYQRLNFDFVRDIAPVASIAGMPNVMTVHPSIPAATVPEFIAYAKANAGKINMGSGGIGSPAHMSGELFKLLTGVNLAHVPYRGGGPATIDLLAGQVHVMFGTLPQSVEYIRAGKVRALAVTTAMRSSVLPDVPAMSDFLPGYETSGWTGIGAPRNTPAQIIDKLNAATNSLLADRTIVARFADLGLAPLAGSPADFARLIADDVEKWAKVIQAANIRVE